MATSCTADRASSTASDTRSTVPACCCTSATGNWISSPSAPMLDSARVLVVVLLGEPRLEGVNDRAAGLGVGTDCRLHLGRDLGGEACLCLAHDRHDLSGQLFAAQPLHPIVEVELLHLARRTDRHLDNAVRT